VVAIPLPQVTNTICGSGRILTAGHRATEIAGIDLGIRQRTYSLQTIEGRNWNWIDNIVRRNCRLKHLIGINLEGRIKLMEVRVRTRKQMMDDLKEKIGYWKLKEKTLASSQWRTFSKSSIVK
jgi:hypothetical protein